jgi:hypothetical protein
MSFSVPSRHSFEERSGWVASLSGTPTANGTPLYAAAGAHSHIGALHELHGRYRALRRCVWALYRPALRVMACKVVVERG